MVGLVKKSYNLLIYRWFLLAKYWVKGSRIHPLSLLVVDGDLITKGSFTVHAGSVIRVPKDASLVIDTKVWLGKNVEIEAASHFAIGKDTSIQDRCTLLGNITIGDGCLFAKNVYISSGQHYFDYKSYFFIKDQDLLIRENSELNSKHHASVIIEDDCWIGINSVIMRGIKIGKGSVIGSNSVVTHDVPPYSIVAGVPARVIRSRVKFKPPKVILASCDEDLPYFWKGCYTRNADLRLNRDLYNGILVENDFMLCLNVENSSSIFMEARYKNKKLSLIHNNQEIEILKEYSVVRFRLEFNSDNLITFKVLGNNMPSLVIKKVWVE